MLRSCRTIWRRWRCLPSTPDVVIAEICGLRWEWEDRGAELGTSVFIIPGIAGEEWRRTAGCSQPDRAIRREADVVSIRHTCSPSQRARATHVELSVEEGRARALDWNKSVFTT